MPTSEQYSARQAAERASLVRWFTFTDRVDANAMRLAADVVRHSRLVMGEDGDNAYVCCEHPMHGRSHHWVERPSWPCEELLRISYEIGIDIADSIEAQRELDELAYGPPLDPVERRRRYDETLPPGLRSTTT